MDDARRQIRVEIAASLAQSGQFDEAVRILDAVDFAWDRVPWPRIVDCMPGPEHASAADRLIARAELWLPRVDEFLDTYRRVELLGELALAAGRAGLRDATLRLAGELRRHEQVEAEDQWNPAGQILMGQYRERARRARASRIAALGGTDRVAAGRERACRPPSSRGRLRRRSGGKRGPAGSGAPPCHERRYEQGPGCLAFAGAGCLDRVSRHLDCRA